MYNDITVKQVPVITQQDIDEKVPSIFKFLQNATPDSVSSIYAYQLTGNPVYLSLLAKINFHNKEFPV
jgi:uncharacterized protein (UPF0297 family)